jgi:CelD/BcsL family acetyltransferase involved in cellulose biosynthesis
MALAIGLEHGVDRATLGQWWRDLEARANCRFFLSWVWIGTWLEVANLAPQVLVARAEGRIVGLALLVPGQVRRRLLVAEALHLHATGDPAIDVIAIEHNGILADSEFADAPHAMLHHLLANGGDWEELHCPGVAPEFAQAVEGREIRAETGSALVDLAALRVAGKPYLDQLSANTRQQIRRAMRGYGDLALDVAATAEAASTYLDALATLHQAYWTARGKPGAFASPFFGRFHSALIERHFAAGLVELVQVTAGGAPIGYLYNFLWRGGVDAYQSGFAYAEDARLKPGLVSHALCIERHLAAGAVRYDFLAGDARYKLSLGQPGPRLAHVVVQRSRLKFTVERALRKVKRAVSL